MNSFLHNREGAAANRFCINYPYYGLFGKAEVQRLENNADPVFECKLLNGAVLLLKKLTTTKKWIDANLNIETPLASVLGIYIDDFTNSKVKLEGN